MKLKGNISFFFAVSILSSLLFATSVFAAGYGYLNDSGVNSRSSASSGNNVIGSFDKGAEVYVSASEGDWLKVTYNDKNLYVARIYVDITRADAVVSGSGVNMRSNADAGAGVIRQLSKGEAVTVTGVSGNWYQIINGDGKAYVSKEFLTGDLLDLIIKINDGSSVEYSNAKESVYGIVKSETGLNLRSEPSTGSKVLEVMSYNDTVDIIENNGEWLKVKSWLGNTGYVASEFMDVKTGVKPENASSSRAAQIIAYAKQFMGTPYVYGGTNLNKGVDCSGFVYSVFKNFGISLNRSSAGMASNGVYVEKANLQPGDLVLFDTTGANDGGISHVGMYIGNGQYIHSTSGREYCVTISELNNDYGLRTYVTARRVL